MEVTSSSQAASSSSTHHGPLGSSHILPHSADDEAAGGEEGIDGLDTDDSNFNHGQHGSIGSSSLAHHHQLSLDVATPSSSLTIGVISPSPGVDGDNLNNAIDVGGTGMELVSYGPAFPPFYSSENTSYSKDIRDSKAVHGSCGLYNLGNTCFMNAGLQSLVSCAPLVKFFCENYMLTDSNRHTLTAHFHLLLCKMWSGQFSVVHPRKFKDFLGMYHSQFEDYRQHDCQEFLALLLDTLHEQLNKAVTGLFQGSSIMQLPALAETTLQSSHNECADQSSSEVYNSNITLNNKDQIEERQHDSNEDEALVLPKIGSSLQTNKVNSVITSCVKEMGTSDQSPASPLSEGSPASEVSMLESVLTSPSSLADSASSSKSPERSVVQSASEKGGEVIEEEEVIISSTFPPLQQHTSKSNIDDVTSSDCGVLLVKPSLKRVSSGSSMSTSYGQLVLHSEDSNHSSLSAHSTDSEQSSAFKRLKIETTELGRNSSSNNSSHLKEYVTSSSDCSKKIIGMGKDKASLLLDGAGVCFGEHSIGGKSHSEADGVSAGLAISPIHDLNVIDNMVSSCQDQSVYSSGSTLRRQSPKQKADSASAALQQPMSPLHLSCLDDFYSKETKTLNTNVQVSEFPQEITADSEKFVKVDNRNRPPSKEVNILQEAIGEENKTDKVLIGESLGSGVKDINLYAQSSNASVVKPCKNVDLNVLHNSLEEVSSLGEQSTKLSFVYQAMESNVVDKDSGTLLKPGEVSLAGVTSNISGIKFDENEKNVQMQAYSKFNTTPVRSNIREDLSNTVADTNSMEVDEVELLESSDDDDLELVPSSHTSTVEACSSVPNCLRHNCHLSEVKMATSAWEEYHARNDSVVVSTFQGQFRSTVVCSECSHVSVTYEPFMYLSLPIPHAMDLQICVTYISECKPPIKYLLNMLKTDKVSAAKLQLNQLLGKAVDEDMVMAEVLDSHISRILDNNVLLKYVNTFNRKIYAFEVITSTSCSFEISTTNPDGAAECVVSSVSLLKEHESSLSKSRLGQVVTQDCRETSNQSFDSVIVNSPSSRDALEGMLSDSEGCEAEYLTFSSSSQIERQAEASTATYSSLPGDSGDGDFGQCLPSSSAEKFQGNSWFMGDCVGASRLPCTYDEDYDKDDDDAGDTLLSKPGKRSSTHKSSSSKISSSLPILERQSPRNYVVDTSHSSSPPSQFWIDEQDLHKTEKTKTLLDEDEDNEADAGPVGDLTPSDIYSSEDVKGGKIDISTSDKVSLFGNETAKGGELETKAWYSQPHTSPSSSVTATTSTTTVSSSSNNHHQPYRDQVSSSQNGSKSSPHSPSFCPGVCMKSDRNYTDASSSCGGSGHLSRSCPSPKNFSEVRGPEEEATLLGAVAKLSENPGSYFLQSRRIADYEEEDFYSDQGDESSSKDVAIAPVHSDDQSRVERECEDPDWPNTFPVHNFTASDLPQASLSDQWKSCAICLEDLLDAELLTHVMCDGVFCQNCLEMSVKHTADISAFNCPICLHPANMCEDFVPLASASASRPKIRTVQICVAFRRSVKDNTGTTLLQLFGHPNIVHLPNLTTGQALYSLLNGLISPFIPVYSILLTDGQGLRCSRCPYSVHCSGCQVSREACELNLQPSDCLTVHVSQDLTADQLNDLQLVHDDATMAGLRSSEPTTIMDCFGAFTQSELLDEHNPWFCPRCERNQCAKKTMTVWRYPDNLIIHLKRFVYQDLSSTKVDAKVVFPQEGMDVRGFLSGPSTVGLLYDLHSIICHMGGASAGHYTCFTRHPLTHQWYYYNDESVTAQEPGESEFTSGYVLFYQRQGTEVEFTVPENTPCLDDDQSDGAIPLGPPTSSAASKNVTTCAASLAETAITTTKPQPRAGAFPSSSISASVYGDDEEDDYDNEQRCLPCDEDDDSSLTVHFGSSFPSSGQISNVSSAHADGVDHCEAREEAGGEVSSVNDGDDLLTPSEISNHSFVEPDSTFSFI